MLTHTLFDQPFGQLIGLTPGEGALLAEIVVPSTSVSAALTNFVVTLRLSSMPPLFWSTVKSDGGDIRIYNSSMELIPFDVAWIDTGTEDGVVFFKASLSNVTDNQFFIEWRVDRDLLAVGDTNGRNAVWSDYECVYLLRNDLVDRTGNHDLSLAAGTSTFDSTAFGNIGAGGGWVTDGNDRLHATITGGTDSTFTLAATGKVTLPSGGVNYTFCARNAGFGSGASFPHRHTIGARDSSGTWSNWDQRNTWNDGTTPVVSNVAVRLHGVWNGTTHKKLYVNGSQDAEDTTVTAITGPAEDFYVGSGGAGTDGQLNGAVSFVYLRMEALSAAWIAAEYLNLNAPGSFYSVSLVTESGSLLLSSIDELDPDEKILLEGDEQSGTDVLLW